MTVNEIIMQGVTVTIQGILVVFLILVLIMLIIKAMSLFMSKGEKKAPQMSVEEPVEVQAPEEEDEEELIAVITAAVAACMGQSAASVNIRSYKKVSSAWGNAAKREILDNRF